MLRKPPDAARSASCTTRWAHPVKLATQQRFRQSQPVLTFQKALGRKPLLPGRRWEAWYGNMWDAELNIAMGKGAEVKVNVLRMVDHIILEGDPLFAYTP